MICSTKRIAAALVALTLVAASFLTGCGAEVAVSTAEQDRALAETRSAVDAALGLPTTDGMSPEWLVDLAEGTSVTVSESQMEYLNRISRSLDDKSPRQINELMNRLPLEARTGLANSLQLVSNPRVTVLGRRDSAVPPQGGKDLLPMQIRQSLERDDLVVREWKTVNGRPFFSTELNGVNDNQIIAQIAGRANNAYMVGSELNSGLIAVGREYVNAQASVEQSSDSNVQFFSVDGQGDRDRPVAEAIFSAVGTDRVAVIQALTDPRSGVNFVVDVLTKNWADDGAAAASLFRFAPDDAFVENPNDRLDVLRATQSGQIMSAVGESMSGFESWQRMATVPGSNGQAIGQMNPTLLRVVSMSMRPYVGRLVGGPYDDRPGFSIAREDDSGNIHWWVDPGSGGSFLGSRRVMALLNSDDEAGILILSAAMGEIVAQERAFSIEPGWMQLSRAGSLLGLIDESAKIAFENQFDNYLDHAIAVRDRKSSAYEFLRANGNHSSYESVKELDDQSGGLIEELFVGRVPSESIGELIVPSTIFMLHFYLMISWIPEIPSRFVEDYSDVFDSNGSLLPYKLLPPELDTWVSDVLSEMINIYAGRPGGVYFAFKDSYNDVRNWK